MYICRPQMGTTFLLNHSTDSDDCKNIPQHLNIPLELCGGKNHCFIETPRTSFHWDGSCCMSDTMLEKHAV